MKPRGRIMRAAVLAAGMLAFAALAYADEEKEEQLAKQDVPGAVLSAFEKTYSKAVVKGYSREEKDGKTLYEVESLEGKIHRDVSYLEDGSLVLVEEVVAVKSLPEAVRQTVKKEHPKGKIELAEKIMQGTTIKYEVVVTEGKKKLEIKLDASGKVLKSEEAQESE